MKAYSLEFRQKIVGSYLNNEGSIRQIAERFNVARSFVQKLLTQHRTEGNLEPKRPGGKVEACTKVTEEHLEILKDIVEKDNDATLEEIQSQLYERCDLWVSISTISRRLIKMNITRKKKRLSQKKHSQNEYNKLEKSIERKSKILTPKTWYF